MQPVIFYQKRDMSNKSLNALNLTNVKLVLQILTKLETRKSRFSKILITISTLLTASIGS